MLLDTASLYFRAFYGVPTSVTSPDGRPVNAVRGFLDMTARLVVAHRPSTVLLADRVALLQDGRITHIGEHRHLLATVPAYRDLLAADADLEEVSA